MHIPRPPGGPGSPGPGPGWGDRSDGSAAHFGFFRGFVYNLCSAISSCFYFLCCCWVSEYWFGGQRRSLGTRGSPLIPPESAGGPGPSQPWPPGPSSMPFEQPGPPGPPVGSLGPPPV